MIGSNSVPSLRKIGASYPREKWRADPLWTKYVLRPLALPATWVALKFGISANQVTYLSVLAALVGTGFMAFDSRQFVIIIIGAILFNLWALLDCVDGNVARMRGTASKYGEFIDAFGGYSAYALVFLAAGIAAENALESAPGYMSVLNFVVFGAVASISNLAMRLLYKQFASITGQDIYGLGTSQRLWARELGLTGFLMPGLVVGLVLGLLHWLVLFYAVYHLIALGFVSGKLIRAVNGMAKVERHNNNPGMVR